MTSESHYDAAYFDWQRAAGVFGGVANLPKFSSCILPSDRVLDFGCGGGFLLANIKCAQRVGVEINPYARAVATGQDIETHATLLTVPSNSVDVVISDNAIEHVDLPLAEIKDLLRVLKPGGRAVLLVPCEGILTPDRGKADPDQHLHSWSPGAFANLCRRAGFYVDECRPFIHRWPPKAAIVQQTLGWPIFHVVSRTWGVLAAPKIAQVRAVCRKPGG